ncbi:uncharacterized protein C8R40DRAFT_1124129 [Lentinula edodes]|uniref:uncharacterized protein n=1 Tax=Lentinula edodes TaxID=5353 RepID=UPI001E8D85D6|nr:uncharacterized protein C8R40DRAFT_1124129 [Lentinula edodes]KAH7871086.1 hypothetical protein C8R40DRAFT_1124129 [Lentinula edodes]
MAHHPLAALKEGLAKLRKQYEERHNILKSKLAKKEKISNEDEQWLDKEGNLVEEEQLINDLENASEKLVISAPDICRSKGQRA